MMICVGIAESTYQQAKNELKMKMAVLHAVKNVLMRRINYNAISAR